MTLWHAYLLVALGYFMSGVPTIVGRYRALMRCPYGESDTIRRGILFGMGVAWVGSTLAWPLWIAWRLSGAFGPISMVVLVPRKAATLINIDPEAIGVHVYASDDAITLPEGEDDEPPGPPAPGAT